MADMQVVRQLQLALLQSHMNRSNLATILHPHPNRGDDFQTTSLCLSVGPEQSQRISLRGRLFDQNPYQ